MNLTVLLGVLSVGGLILAFVVDVINADQADRRKWKLTVAAGAALLAVNIGVELVTRIADAQREGAERHRQAQIDQFMNDIRSEVQLLSRAAADAYKRLDKVAITASEPVIRELREKADAARRQIERLEAVVASGDAHADLENLGRLLEETNQTVRELTEEIRREEVNPNRGRPAPVNDGLGRGNVPSLSPPSSSPREAISPPPSTPHPTSPLIRVQPAGSPTLSSPRIGPSEQTNLEIRLPKDGEKLSSSTVHVEAQASPGLTVWFGIALPTSPNRIELQPKPLMRLPNGFLIGSYELERTPSTPDAPIRLFGFACRTAPDLQLLSADAIPAGCVLTPPIIVTIAPSM